MYQTSALKLVKSEPLARVALAAPAMGTLIGSVLLAFGGSFPCLLMDAAGFLLGLLILIALVLKFLWIEHLLMDGEEIEVKVINLKDNPGMMMVQTTEVEYQYSYDGVQYKKRILVHLPENEHLNDATLMVDPDRPDNSFIKELYCVPCR